jgi:cytochrome c oxidase subunit 1
MNTMTAEKVDAAATQDSFLTDLRAWCTNVGPLPLARRHLALGLVWLTLGMLAAFWLRLELLTPGLDAMQARTFGALLSLHGFLMFYLIALPIFPGVIGQLALSLWMPDAKRVLPRLAAAAWFLLALGGVLMMGALMIGGTEVGWSFDAGFGGRFDQPGTVPVALGVLCVSLGLALMAIQMLASLRMLRSTGMPAGGARILAEALGCASVLMAVVAPLMGVAMILVLSDALGGLSLFAPALGGDPQHFVVLIRLFFGPAQNMVLLFALGTALGVVAERTREGRLSRSLFFGFMLMLVASLGGWGAEIATLSSARPVVLLGGQPMNVLLFSAFLLCFVAALRHLRSGILRSDAALVYALAFLVTAAQGLGVGLLTSFPAGAAQFGNTQLASAQLHLMMMANLGLGLMSGLHAYWTRLTGRSFSDGRARALAWLVIVGTQLAFVPLLLMGLRGASYRANAYPPEFQVWQVMATAGSTVLMVGWLLAILNLVASRRAPRLAVAPVVLALVLALAAVGCGSRAAAQPETVQVKITGMHCESCAQSITKKLKRAGGVLETDVHFSNEVQTVRYDAAQVQVPALVTTITNLGFAAEVVAAQP